MKALPIAFAAIAVCLGGAGPVTNASPTSPDRATTALQRNTVTHLGITPNSMGTTTQTGTPAQSAAREYPPGKRGRPPNVLQPLGPVPPIERLPVTERLMRPPARAPAGHTRSGNFSGMAGAVNSTASMPMNPYVPILGHPKQDTDP